jgi:hypothetical protein
MTLYNAEYYPTTKTLIGTHNSGFYSCINCLRISLYKLISQGIIPDRISLEDTLNHYKDAYKQDLYQFLYQKNESAIGDLKFPFDFEIFCPTQLRHDKLPFEYLTPIENAYFYPSNLVLANCDMLMKKYNINLDKTIAVLHRGNDKWKETKLNPVEDWIRTTESKYQEGYKIIIQTDEASTKERFLSHFGDRCFFFQEMIFANSYHTNIIPANRKVEWAILFECVMRIISKCNKIINHNGNCALVPILYRGNLEGEVQFFEGTPYQYRKD